jgi:HEAT repeat protein
MRNTLALSVVLSACAGPSAERRAAERVVWQSLTAPDVGERREATRIAVELADPTLDAALPARLVDADAVVRATAAAALATDVEAARAVLRQALSAPEPAARVAALDGVAPLADGGELAARAAGDPDEAVRARAAWILAGMKAAELVERLAADAAAGVRAEALRALSSFEPQRAAQLAEPLLADPSLAVRLSALSALARCGDRGRLLSLAGAADRWVALRAAVQLKDDAALAAVEKAAADPQASLRVAAVNAAGELGERGRKLAITLLADRDLEVRLAAARAVLSTGGEETARRVLQSALRTPRRLEAADELARMGDADGRRALAEASHDADAATRRAAVAALGALSPAPELEGALADPDAGVRLAAARALLRRVLRPYLR